MCVGGIFLYKFLLIIFRKFMILRKDFRLFCLSRRLEITEYFICIPIFNPDFLRIISEFAVLRLRRKSIWFSPFSRIFLRGVPIKLFSYLSYFGTEYTANYIICSLAWTEKISFFNDGLAPITHRVDKNFRLFDEARIRVDISSLR